MELNVQRIVRGAGTPLEGGRKCNLSARDFPGYRVDRPADVTVYAVFEGGALRLELDIRALVQSQCARCLCDVGSEQHIPKEYQVDPKDLEGGYPELPMLENGCIDLEELVFGELVIEVPGAILCSPDCKGLCQRCGTLKANCSCPPEQTGDERMQVLKQLL